MSQYESIWIKDPMNIIRFNNFSINTSNNKFNAMTRCLLITMTICILFNRHEWTYITLMGIIITSTIGYIYDNHVVKQVEKKKLEKYHSCRRSTIDNPMGNILPFDPTPHLKACDEKKEVIDDNLFHGYLRDPNDDNNEGKMRQFVTLPVTSIHDNRDDFIHFLYNGHEEDDNEYKSCKYDGVNCERYRDLRYAF